MPVASKERSWWPPSRRAVGLAAMTVAAGLLLIQLVPYGHAHSNPPVTKAAKWPPGPGQEIAEAG